MSNPLVQPSQPISELARFLSRVRFAHFEEGTVPSNKEVRDLRNPEVVRTILAATRVSFVSSVYLDSRVLDPNLAARVAKGKVLATATLDGLAIRVRHAELAGAVVSVVERIGVLEGPPFTKADVLERIRLVVQVSGGAHCSLRRLGEHLPRRGPVRPPTRSEAVAAIVALGVPDLKGVLPRWLFAPDAPAPSNSSLRAGDEGSVEANFHASTGFPRLTSLTKDIESRVMDDAAKWYSIMRTRWDSLEREWGTQARPRFQQFLMEQRAAAPLDFLCRGKTKTDPYKLTKVMGLTLRFYNVIPRAHLLIMQMACQAFESACVPITDSDLSTNSQGLVLVRGGADRLVTTLDNRLADERAAGVLVPCAYTNCGDDSWLAFQYRVQGVWFTFCVSKDGTAFDLTQASEATEAIHAAIRERLAVVEPVSAELWYFYARERLVAVSGSCVIKTRDGGPSGMALQSKVNGALMGILQARLCSALKELPGDLSLTQVDSTVGDLISSLGSELGLKLRLEQLESAPAESVREVLRGRHFLYLGYYFWTSVDGLVRCYADAPRMLAQLPYLERMWVHNKTEAGIRAALKLGGVAMASGQPPACLAPAYSALVGAATGAIGRARRAVAEMDAEEFDAVLSDGTGVVFAGISHDDAINILRGDNLSDVIHSLWDPAVAMLNQGGTTTTTDSDHPGAEEIADWYESIVQAQESRTTEVCGAAYTATAGETHSAPCGAYDTTRPRLSAATSHNFGRPPPEPKTAPKSKEKEEQAPARTRGPPRGRGKRGKHRSRGNKSKFVFEDE